MNTKSLIGLTNQKSSDIVSQWSNQFLNADFSRTMVDKFSTKLECDDKVQVVLFIKYCQAFNIRLDSCRTQNKIGNPYTAFSQILWIAKFGDGVATRQLTHALKELWNDNADVIKNCKQMGGSFVSSLFEGDINSSFSYADNGNKRALIIGFCDENNRDEEEMQKVLSNYQDEEMYFNYWMHSGNVVENVDGSFSTQDAQYRNRFVDIAQLKKYYNKEFAYWNLVK